MNNNAAKSLKTAEDSTPEAQIVEAELIVKLLSTFVVLYSIQRLHGRKRLTRVH